ncbi:GDP/UDP-N,N'-diacetylbacillosamine 2-epimerase (hydrolysing) [Paenibacillus uliginis N3/975]|uniref:GDP/UDP-N,N'-diacetylbacillosamine 2-epimerase (Hydrolysing) n=1 Tax=Paenibacillus uliginis N3/975 TaxID=1313296 RepID=A0A1X7GC64_9BACL|nr:UDP-N-acetylglucosamine 2-epimerase [Paenibacillus uliginis]SMF67518.1 GDP/UDP-N,N'-diacetylbacillosamine 2-epimerase (hydrolysing) [Paenibacillus uliginis N3/975]
MKKILVVTGTRADYGIYFPIMQAIEADSSLNLHLLVTGMHLSPQHGLSLEQIQKDGFKISAKVPCLLHGSTHANMSRGIGLAVMGMTQAMEELEPDGVIVLGDRGEMLAAAIVSTYMNIPLFHLHGGEVSGTIDESVRHAISKLAHVHLAATEGSKERLIKLGENDWRIHVVGAPRLETIEKTVLPKWEDVAVQYGLPLLNEYILFVYHPVTTEEHDLLSLREMLDSLIASEQEIVCIMPNSDAGADSILEVYDSYSNERLHRVTNFEQLHYLAALKNCSVLVGNSSSGIIEAASFHVPVINIGTRQHGRERSDNVVDIPVCAATLAKALEQVFSDPFQQKLKTVQNVYSQPETSTTIVNILNNISYSQDLIQKTITY